MVRASLMNLLNNKGDAVNMFPLLDHKMHDMFRTLAPHYNIADTSTPCKISKLLTMDTPNNTILANYLEDRDLVAGDDSLIQEL